MADKSRRANVGAVLAVLAGVMFFSGVFCGPAEAQEQWLGYRSATSAYGHIGSTAGQKFCPQDKAPEGVGPPADEGQARRILAGWGATALPHIVVTDASHTVTAEAVTADALEAMLKDSTGASQPAPAATSGPVPTGPAIQPPAAGTTTQPARCLRLILLDDAGKPVEGADVVLGNSSDKQNGRPAAVTDSRGRCSIPVGTMQADYWGPKITKPGYVPMESWLGKAEAEKLFAEETTLRITKGQTIGGVVRDEQGQPIKDVVLGFYWYSPNRPRQAIRDDMQAKTVRTDKEGRWVCDFAPPELDDNFRIFLRHPEYVSDRWDSGTIPMSLYPRPNQEELSSGKAVYVMKAGLVLAGKVTDIDGKPIRGAQVRMIDKSTQSPANSERTNADGCFTFSNAEDSAASCMVLAKGFAPEIVTIDPRRGESIVVKLAPARPIRGKVIDARGMPVAGAGVYVSQWRGQYGLLNWSTQTDKDGCFVWSDAPADGATFDIYKEGYMRQSNTALVPSDTEQLITLGDPLRVTGRVLDADTGKPVEGVRIIRGIDWGRGSRTSWDRLTQTPVKDGKYETEITSGYPAYIVRAEADGYTPAVSESIPRDAGRRTVDFRMERGKPIVGRVIDPDGKPIAGVEVHVATADQQAYIRNGTEFEDRRNAAKVTTAADGSFSLPPDDQAFTIVVLTDAGYAEVGIADLLKAQQVRLAPWGRIEGVVMQGAKPLPKASVGASAAGNHQMPMVYHELRMTADEQGRFVLPRVPPGKYQVHRTIMSGNIGYHVCDEKVTVEAGKAATVTIGGKGRTVIARLNRPVPADGGMNGVVRYVSGAHANIMDAASMAIGQQMVALRPANWDKMDAAQQDKWAQEWRQSEEGKAFIKLSQEVQKKSRYIPCVLQPDGKLEAWEVPSGQYVLNVSLGRVAAGAYVSEGTVRHTFEVPPIKGNDLDTPLDLGVLKVESPVVMPADNAGGQGRVYTDGTKVTTTWIPGPATIKGGESPAGLPAQPSSAAGVLNQPLKLDMAAAVAGKKLLVVAASIEQRPSRRILDILAASQAAIANQGFAVVLVHPAVTDEKQVKKWLADHKLDVAQVILAKDQADAARLMSACGAESLPFMLTTDDKHVVTVLDIQPDKLDQLRGLGQPPAAKPQSTTSPASTQPAADAAEIERLIKQLGSDKFAEREAAQQALVKIGEPAKATLQAAARDKKQERASRAVSALKQIEESLLVGTTGWGQPNDGLRCRWLFSNRPVPVGTQPELTVEVQNVSKELIKWQCRSEMTLGVTFGGNGKQGGAMPQFLIESAGGVSATGSGLAIPAGGTVRLKARWPYVVHKPGRYHVEAILVRQPIPVNESTAFWPKTFTCSPMVVSVADAAGRVPDTDPMEGAAGPWGLAVDGMQVRIYDGLSFHNPGAWAARLSVDIRNFGKSSMNLLLMSDPLAASRGMPAKEAIEVEVDGVWYRGGKTVGGTKTTPLGPGNRYRDMEVMPANDWLDKDGKRLNLGTVKRTVRVAVTVQPADGKGKPVRLVSNAVVLRSAAELPEYRTATTAPTTTSAPHAAGPASIQPDKLGRQRCWCGWS
jgi:protocatechuate 3,4-dioxygenase beta subunit